MSKWLAAGAIFGLSTATLYKFMTARVFDKNAVVAEPPFTSIVMCTLNEENFIRDTLESLEDQNVRRKYPDNFELILIDSNSEDRTVEIAESYGWTVFQAPRGKLTARHIGMEKAQGQVIVSVDADTYYPPNWLNLILGHFSGVQVVAVSAPRIGKPEEAGILTVFSVWLAVVDIGPIGGMRLPGQSCAVRKEAYFEVGGFNLDINQLDVHEMVREEEIIFGIKLRRIGRVIVNWQAPVFTSARRCMFVGKGKKYREWTEARLAGERF